MKINKESQNITSMFDTIAPTYDMLNHLLSLNIDKSWRTKLIKSIPTNTKTVLDVATGTGDIAIAIAEKLDESVVEGVDISKVMLDVGFQKVKKIGLENRISLKQQNCMSLEYENDFFDIVTCAFGVRNFENFTKGMLEMYRVTKPGGKILILEFSLPKYRVIYWFYSLYFYLILPIIGFFISKNMKAYTYLPQSVKTFPYGKRFVEQVKTVGISNISFTSLSLGIATLYEIDK